jgi:hypothetical protein
MGRQMVRAAIWGALIIGISTASTRAAGWSDTLFSEKGHDFGPVPRGAKVRHNFVLTNRLAEAITIVDVRASCGCTSGKSNTSIVAPGHAAIIEAEMDTRNFVGPKSTVLYVSVVTAGGQEGEVQLGVKSNILSDIVLNPGTIDFGAVARGQTPSQVLTIDRISSPEWRVERMISACRVINAQLVETTRNDATVSYTLTVSLKADAPAGTIRDEIRLITNDPETPSFPVLVTAQIRGDLSASPSVLAMGSATSAEPVQGRFVVRATRPFRIQAIGGEGEGFKATTGDGNLPKTLHVVTVTYRPDEGKTRGELRRTFRVVTDLQGEVPLDLTATLHVAP